MIDQKKTSLETLRQEAEKKVAGHHDRVAGSDQQQLKHSLKVYEIELEMQNQELRETQLKLQQTLDRYSCLFHQSPVGHITLDDKGRIQDLNESFANLLGYSASKLRFGFLAGYCTPETGDILRERLPAFFKKPEDKVIEVALKGASGTIFLVDIQGRNLPDTPFLACNIIDRTAGKIAEEALRESEAQLQAVMAAARNAVLMMNSKGIITYCNPANLRVLGYQQNEILGRNLHQLLAPTHYLAAYRRGLTKFQHSGSGAAVGETTELKALHKDGRELDIELSLSSVSLKGEWHAVGIIRDITQRKRTDSLLAAQLRLIEYANDNNLKSLLRKILDEAEALTGSCIAFYHFVEKDQTTLTLQTWSTNTINTMCSATPENQHYPIDSAGVWVDCVREKKPVTHNDYSALRHKKGLPEGHAPVIRELVVPLFRDGQIVAILGVGNKKSNYDQNDIDTVQSLADFGWEIVNRKRVEESLLQRTAELEQRTAELERFNYTASHDLKSPLVTVKSFLGFLEQDMKNGDTDRISKDMEYIHTAIDRMESLLNDLLQMSQIGWAAEPAVDISYLELLQQVQILLAGSIAKSAVTIRTLTTDDLLLHGERARLLEVWQNLIGNAIKYMGNQPHPLIELGTRQEENELIFFVRDNGIGIEPQFARKIFGLFEKLERNSEGSGLGLALIKRIIEKNNGRIWVESAGAGQGSCFYFTLPGVLKH